MKEEISELLKRAMALPPAARAALAGSLLESLDETVDEGAEAEWQKEIALRMQGLRDIVARRNRKTEVPADRHS